MRAREIDLSSEERAALEREVRRLEPDAERLGWPSNAELVERVRRAREQARDDEERTR